jgi:hypothetical protein
LFPLEDAAAFMARGDRCLLRDHALMVLRLIPECKP